mmetsp:Transcript_28762/g.61045  ORF Transcript_28762/g.61045 Transcript_28762/m.61045 type:complete len:210 (+) Transcript_28762:207-836(+)
MKIDIHPEDDIPVTEQNIRLRRRNTFHRTKMIKVCVSEFVDSHDNFIDAHFDFGIPYHILSADSHEKQALRIRRSSEDPHCYSISAMLSNKNNIRVQYFVKAWYGDDEVCNNNGEEAYVDAKSWLPLGEIDLDDVMDYAQDGEGMLSVLLNIVVTDEMMLEVEPTWHDEIGSPDAKDDKNREHENRSVGILLRSVLFFAFSQIIQAALK